MRRHNRSKTMGFGVMASCALLLGLTINSVGGSLDSSNPVGPTENLPTLGPLVLIEDFYGLGLTIDCEVSASNVGNITGEFNALDFDELDHSGIATAQFTFNAPVTNNGSGLDTGLVTVVARNTTSPYCDTTGIVGVVLGTLMNGDNYSINLAVQRTANGIPIGPGLDLSGESLGGANLTGADLSGADLSSAFLGSVNATFANLSLADLSGANLGGASFAFANLAGADLSGAFAASAVSFQGANLTGADLSGVTFGSVNWSNTTCPNGINANDQGGTCL